MYQTFFLFHNLPRDSTLFEFKGVLNEAPGTLSNNPNKLKTPRPASAQTFKINSHLVSPTFLEAPKIGFPTHSLPSNRNRPVSAIKSPNKMMQNESSTKNLHYIIPGDIRPEEDARLIEKVANGEPMQMPDIQKLMPRKIKFDKERLYEDTLHLKQTNNNLRDENMRLKTKNLNLERENIKLVRCLERAGNIPVEPGRQNESALMAALKKQVKDLKDDNKLREEELELIKRNIKFTKFQELEVELKAYADENIRITGMFDELLRAKPHVKQEDYNSLEEQYHMQNNLVDTLQRENSRLSAEIKFLEDTNYNLQVTRELDLKNIQKQQAEIGKLRKQLKEKETKPAQNLRPESASAKTSQRVEDKAKVEEENNELKKLLEHRDQMIHQRDKALEDLKLKFNDRMINDAKEKQNLAHEINNLKDQLTDLESKYRAVVNIHHPAEENKRRSPEGRASPKYDEDLPSDSRIERSLAFESKAKKVKKVRLEDVSTLGYELSLRLRVRRIVLEEIMKFLERFGPKISIFEMKNLLAHDPFGIKDENNALLIARYLIEPNDDEILTFDVNRTQDLSIIKSVFRKLVGSYTLLSEEEEKVMNTEVGEIIHKFEQGLLTQFTIMPESKTGYLSSEQILKAFKMIDIAITPKNFEYLIMNLYEYTGSLKKLDYNKMFEIFETEEHKRLKRIIEMYQNQNDLDSDRSEKKVKFKDDEERKTQPNSPEKKPRHELEDFDGEDDDNLDEEEDDEGEDEGDEEGEEEEEEAEEGNQTSKMI